MTYQILSVNRQVYVDTDRLWEAWAKSGTKKLELAKAVGVHRATIKNWLSKSKPKKRITTNQVRAISRACNCSVEYLLGLDDNQEIAITSSGKALRYLRLKKGLTQRQLASRVFSNQYSICRWENGKAKIPKDMAKIFADFFGVTPEFILNWRAENEN